MMLMTLGLQLWDQQSLDISMWPGAARLSCQLAAIGTSFWNELKGCTSNGLRSWLAQRLSGAFDDIQMAELPPSKLDVMPDNVSVHAHMHGRLRRD